MKSTPSCHGRSISRATNGGGGDGPSSRRPAHSSIRHANSTGAQGRRSVLYKTLSLLLLLISLVIDSAAQVAPKIVASTRYRKYSLEDVSRERREAFLQLDAEVAKQRTDLLDHQIGDLVLSAEAKKRGITVQDLKRQEISDRVGDPTDAEVKSYYEANSADFESVPLEHVKRRITRYLHWQAEEKRRSEFVAVLGTKHAVARGKEVNAPNLAGDDVLAAVGDEKLTVKQFEAENSAKIWATRADAYENLIDELEKTMFTELLSIEAKEKGVASSDKLVNAAGAGSDDDEDRLKDSLFAKYDAKIYLKRPQYHQDISVEGAPFRGDPNAVVTVVVFSDFQCPRCAKAHQILEKVTAEFGKKVRFVVKNYPLTWVHDDAFRAAEASAAAQDQGKFFEYIEFLYNNQESLDEESLKGFASDVHLDRKRFDQDLESGKFAARIKRDLADGDRAQLLGTPTVFVNGAEIYPFSLLTPRNLRNAIRDHLAQSGCSCRVK